MAHWLKRTKDQIADRIAWPEGSSADDDATARSERDGARAGGEEPAAERPSKPGGPKTH